MINLVRNEVYKLLHKKSLWFLSIIILGFIFLTFLSEMSYSRGDGGTSVSEQRRIYVERLKGCKYDSTDKDYCIDFKSKVDQFDLIIKYNIKSYSPEEYFIYNKIGPIINQMNYEYYFKKNESAYNDLKLDYDSKITQLLSFDWKEELQKEKNEYLSELEVLESNKELTGIELDENNRKIKLLEHKIEVVDYRIKNQIPYTSKYESMQLDEYLHYGLNYFEMNKDESLITDRTELSKKQDYEKKYYEYKYRIENNLLNNRDDALFLEAIDYTLVFDYVLLLVIIIISSVIIADEFSSGTIKQLLLRPYSRVQVLTSKIISSFIVSGLFIVMYYGINLLFLMIEYGTFSMFFNAVPVYSFFTREVVEMSFINYCLYSVVITLPAYILTMAITFLLSLITINSAASICGSFGLCLLGDYFMYSLPAQIAAVCPFSCFYLWEFRMGHVSGNPYGSLGLTLFVFVITIVILYVVSYVIFNKKDINNQ